MTGNSAIATDWKERSWDIKSTFITFVAFIAFIAFRCELTFDLTFGRVACWCMMEQRLWMTERLIWALSKD